VGGKEKKQAKMTVIYALLAHLQDGWIIELKFTYAEGGKVDVPGTEVSQ